jgi:exopolysaccharide biosynthesis protein
VGFTADGKVLMVVVDGRQKKWSIGLTLNQFARLFKRLGAVYALNLDGGGSSTMVINGEVVNRPSSGFERRVTNALLVLPGPDPGEPG